MNKDRARGAMALKGALDAEYCVKKKHELISMTATKMKETELSLLPFRFAWFLLVLTL